MESAHSGVSNVFFTALDRRNSDPCTDEGEIGRRGRQLRDEQFTDRCNVITRRSVHKQDPNAGSSRVAEYRSQ